MKRNLKNYAPWYQENDEVLKSFGLSDTAIINFNKECIQSDILLITDHSPASKTIERQELKRVSEVTGLNGAKRC